MLRPETLKQRETTSRPFALASVVNAEVFEQSGPLHLSSCLFINFLPIEEDKMKLRIYGGADGWERAAQEMFGKHRTREPWRQSLRSSASVLLTAAT